MRICETPFSSSLCKWPADFKDAQITPRKVNWFYPIADYWTHTFSHASSLLTIPHIMSHMFSTEFNKSPVSGSGHWTILLSKQIRESLQSSSDKMLTLSWNESLGFIVEIIYIYCIDMQKSFRFLQIVSPLASIYCYGNLVLSSRS